MTQPKANQNEIALPEIIQGGMGAAVSNWRLARAVSTRGELGVISGTAMDTIMARRLQDGDPDGNTRRALAAFPDQSLVEPILNKWFIPGGKASSVAYKLKPLPTVELNLAAQALLIVANFVEVFLAKEGHDGFVGINLLEKIQLVALPSLFGAMLAGADAVLMGGGIPLAIPGVLDGLSRGERVEVKLNLVETHTDQAHMLAFDPQNFSSCFSGPLKRPQFLAVIASDVLAKTLIRKANGKVNGFVVEHHSAGGHNAPPRRAGVYGERDLCDIEKLKAFELPFWLAGGCASPERFKQAQASGARGIQVGTAFACADESGIVPEIKLEIIQRYLKGDLEVITDFQASPTGYPFKRVELESFTPVEACRVCDLGYLRHVFEKEDGTVDYRCPSGPLKPFFNKGGTIAESEGKHCLCNGLLATIGMGQIRDGVKVEPLVTWGEDMSFLNRVLVDGKFTYTAGEMIDFLRSEASVPSPAAELARASV
jgi:nitronate monooxygenase